MANKTHALEIRKLPLQELEQLKEQARARLDAQDFQLLQSLIQTVQHLWQLVEQQDMSMGRLRRLLFGPHVVVDKHYYSVPYGWSKLVLPRRVGTKCQPRPGIVPGDFCRSPWPWPNVPSTLSKALHEPPDSW
jgi:hypothetical protein